MDQLQENENFLKCFLAVDKHLQKAILRIIHNLPDNGNYEGLPKDPEKLYKYFNETSNKAKLKKKLSDKHFKPDQYELLLPKADSRTFSRNWDVALQNKVILNFLKLPKNILEFHKRANKMRNEIIHEGYSKLRNVRQFEETKTRFRKILIGLSYDKMADFDNLMRLKLSVENVLERKQQIIDFENEQKKDKNAIKKLKDLVESLQQQQENQRNGIVFHKILNFFSSARTEKIKQLLSITLCYKE